MLCLAAFLNEVAQAKAALDRWVARLREDFGDLRDFEYRARDVVDRMALALQASLPIRHAPAFVADAFCASRLEQLGHHNYGALPRGVDTAAIIARGYADSGLIDRRDGMAAVPPAPTFYAGAPGICIYSR